MDESPAAVLDIEEGATSEANTPLNPETDATEGEQPASDNPIEPVN